MKRGLLSVLAALVLVPGAAAGGPYMMVGAADDVVLQRDPARAKADLDLAKLAGLDTIRVTAQWSAGDTKLAPEWAARIGNTVDAAKLDGIRVVLSLYPFGSSVTPLTDADRQDFADWATDIVGRYPYVHDFIVGNEPNLNRFWLPQYNADGSDAAAPAYEALLAKTYDAIKAVRPHSTVYGGALAPHGSDHPGIRPTHSPTQFILDMGAAYRASGREVPIMDAIALHPYEDRSDLPPTFLHPKSTAIGIADYDKLVSLLGQAFDGTAQRGSGLPILYDEYGVDAVVPPAKAGLYTGVEPATVHPVSEATQASFYEQALQLTFCQPTVIGLLFFHFVDEAALPAWQSGLYYVDGTPKASLAPVRDAIDQTHRGVVSDCEALQLTPKLALRAHTAADGQVSATLTASLDARYVVSLLRKSGARWKTVTLLRGTAVGGTATQLAFPHRVSSGRYRLHVRATATENPGPAAVVTGHAFSVR